MRAQAIEGHQSARTATEVSKQVDSKVEASEKRMKAMLEQAQRSWGKKPAKPESEQKGKGTGKGKGKGKGGGNSRGDGSSSDTAQPEVKQEAAKINKREDETFEQFKKRRTEELTTELGQVDGRGPCFFHHATYYVVRRTVASSQRASALRGITDSAQRRQPRTLRLWRRNLHQLHHLT